MWPDGGDRSCHPGDVIDEADLHTETFSSARGWTAVRVTHEPSGTAAERMRSASLKSAVEAQRECIAEVKQLLAEGAAPVPPPAPAPAPAPVPVGRAEFDALAVRVSRLEETLDRG